MRVRRQMKDDVWTNAPGDRVHRRTVGDVSFVQDDAVADVEQPRWVDRRHRRRQRVDLGPLANQLACEVRADETGRAGYEDAGICDFSHGSVPFVSRLFSAMAARSTLPTPSP